MVVTANVVAGGMRSITLVQAFQYWFTMMALAVPVFVVAIVTRPGVQSLFAGSGRNSGSDFGGSHPIAEAYSLMLATFLGVMGLPRAGAVLHHTRRRLGAGDHGQCHGAARGVLFPTIAGY